MVLDYGVDYVGFVFEGEESYFVGGLWLLVYVY